MVFVAQEPTPGTPDREIVSILHDLGSAPALLRAVPGYRRAPIFGRAHTVPLITPAIVVVGAHHRYRHHRRPPKEPGAGRDFVVTVRYHETPDRDRSRDKSVPI